MSDSMNHRLAAIMQHEAAARAELDAIHAELEAMAAEAVGHHVDLFHIVTARRVLSSKLSTKISNCIEAMLPNAFDGDDRYMCERCFMYNRGEGCEPLRSIRAWRSAARKYLRDCGEEE